MLRTGRKHSSPTLQLPPAKPKSPPTAAQTKAALDSLVFAANSNPIADAINTAGPGTTGLPGLVNDKVKISPETTEALLAMAKEDPALYGRIVQHMNALDPKKEWSVKLSAFSYGSIDSKLHTTLSNRLDKSQSEVGLGKGGDKTGAFWGTIKYESTEKTAVTKEAQPGNEAEVQALKDELADWNSKFASVFAFDQGVGDKVNNPTESQGALEELIGILESHQNVVEEASFDFAGFTSTEGSDTFNQTLSEARAFTIHQMFSKLVDESSLSGRITLSNQGKGEFAPLDASGNRLSLDASNRPVDASLEDKEKSRRVEVSLSSETKSIEPKDAETKTWREGLEVRLEISAKPEPSKSRVYKHHGDNVHKSPISKQIGGEIPCPKWMKTLFH